VHPAAVPAGTELQAGQRLDRDRVGLDAADVDDDKGLGGARELRAHARA
jgi:hypothetical protein